MRLNSRSGKLGDNLRLNSLIGPSFMRLTLHIIFKSHESFQNLSIEIGITYRITTVLKLPG